MQTAIVAAARARRAVSAIFFVNGAVLASWVAHIPTVKSQHGIADGGLGLVLLSMAVGSVLTLPIAGWLIARWGSRVMTTAAALAFSLALPLPVISPTVSLAVLTLALLGACNALLDVSINAQAVAIEEGYRRPILSSFHGLFSVGGVAGASLASGAMAVGIRPAWHVLGVAAMAVAVVAGVLGDLPSSKEHGRPHPVLVRPPAALLGLGLLTFCGLLAEGAMADWSAVYLHDTLGAPPAMAATGFAAFSLAMAAGRFGGDALARRLGPRLLLRTSAAVAAAGLGGALLLGRTPTAIVGFGLVGLGISNVIPVLFSAAGRVPGTPRGTALAAVATTGYGGYLVGPPLIGLAADGISLAVALGTVSAVCALIAVGAVFLPDRPRSEPLAASDKGAGTRLRPGCLRLTIDA